MLKPKNIKSSEEELEAFRCFLLASFKYLSEVKGFPDLNNSDDSISKSLLIAKSKRISGYRQAANDIVEWSMDWPNDEIDQFDRFLKMAGSKPLAYFRQRNKKFIGRILKKMVISNDDEYYALKGYFETEWNNLESSQIDSINQILAQFERQGQ